MVKHLTFEELLEFNSLGIEEVKTGELARYVTTHIRTCGECRRALSAVQSAESTILGYAKRAENSCPECEGEKRKLR